MLAAIYPLNKNDFFRYCRLLHGWLSAFAFLALCLFSFTGLLLNHPEWLSGAPSEIVNEKYALQDTEIQGLRTATIPAQALVELVTQRIAIKGALEVGDAEGNVVGDEIFVRTRGVRGTSFLHADLKTRSLEVTIETASTLSLLNELHRAERGGKYWRLAVDVIAIALITLSIVGYLIFLSMRGARLRTALLLTAGSALGLWLLFAYAVS